MARPDGRIEKGQRLATAISARAWNRAQDAADRVLGVQTGAEAGALQNLALPYHWVYAVNKGDETMDRFSVVKLESQEITDGWDVDEDFVNQKTPDVVFKAYPIEYTTADTTTNWDLVTYAIPLEPIPKDGCGRVAVSGVCYALIEVVDYSHNFATPRNYLWPGRLRSSPEGPFRILGKGFPDPGEGDKRQLALVQFRTGETATIVVFDDVAWEKNQFKTFRLGQGNSSTYGDTTYSTLFDPEAPLDWPGVHPSIDSGQQSQQSPNYFEGNWNQPEDGRNVTVKVWNLIGYIPDRKRVFCQYIQGSWQVVTWEGQGMILRGEFDAPWSPGGGPKQIVAQDGKTYSVQNNTFSVTGSGTRKCLFAWVDGEPLSRYELISVQYDVQLTVTKNAQGVVTDVSVTM
jgi:hypothetical protein